MDKKSILSEIKKLISFSSETEAVEKVEKFLDAKANGGEIIVRVEADAFEVGLPLFVVTEDGLIAAPAGEHLLEDGTKIYVDEAGLITEIEAPEAEVEAPAAEEVVEMEEAPVVEEEVKEEVKEEDKKIEELEKRVEEIEKMMTEMLSMTKETANFSNVVLGKLENFIKETPAELEFKSVKSEYKQTVKENVDKKFSKLEEIKNFRKK